MAAQAADPFLTALEDVRRPPQTDDPFLSALDDVRRPTAASPSLVRRVADTLLTPLVSPETAARVTGSAAPLPSRGLVGGTSDALAALADLPRLMWQQPVATVKGAARGLVEGGLSLTDPLTIATVVTGGMSRLARGPLVVALRALPEAERAIVAARAAGNVSDIARLRTEIQALHSSADMSRALLRFAHGVDVGSGAVLAGSGVERVASAQTLPEVGAGVAETAFGALGMRTPAHIPERRPIVALHAGELPAARGFAVTPEGVSVPAGAPIPPRPAAPDPSFVRGVPAEYARHDVRGELPPARRRFVVDEAGATRLVEPGSDPFVDAITTVQRQTRTRGSGSVRENLGELSRVARSGGLAADVSGGAGVRAAAVEREYQGRKLVPSVFSSDPTAVDAPLVEPLTPEIERALRWIREDLTNIPFVKRSFNEVPTRHGGQLEVTGGAAGAPIYRAIVGDVSTAGRADVIKALDNVMAGKRTQTGDLVLGVARDLAAGKPKVRRMMTLPPSAGDLPTSSVADRVSTADLPATGVPVSSERVRVQRLDTLPPAQAAVQERAAAAVEANPQAFVNLYRERFGNVVSADLAKELFPEYSAGNATRTQNDLAVHRPARAVAQAAYHDLLHEPTPFGKDDLVVMTAGGTGAGKTSGLRDVLPDLADAAHIVYDSTLSDLPGAIRDIDAALAAGKQVGVVFTDREMVDAFRATLARGTTEGRPVTINTHVRSHLRAAETFDALQQHYGQQPAGSVEFVVIHNGPDGRELVTARTPRGYNESDARATLTQVLEEEHSAGRISDDLYRAVRGTQAPPSGVAGTGRARGRPAAAASDAPQAERALTRPPLDNQSGQISPALVTRLGTGAASAAVGAATGEDTEDRIKRGVIYGAAGFAAPSLLRSGAGRSVTRGAGGALDETLRDLVTLARRRPGGGDTIRPLSQSPMPPSASIPRSRLLTFPSLQKMPAEVRGEIADLLEQHQGFEGQRRGVQPIARTEARSERIAVPLERLTPGRALNAEELAAYKNATTSVLSERQPLAEKIRAGTASDVEKVTFSELTDRATVLVASYRGAKAEAGRALNILRVKARVLEYGDGAFIQKALQAPGFDADLKRIAQAAIEAGGDPLKQLEILRRESRGTAFERAQALYYNGLLSGVKTHLRNTIGNSFNALANLATPVAGAAADRARSALLGTPRTVFLGEMKPSLIGFFSGIPDGFRQAAFTLRHGFTPNTVRLAGESKFDTMRVEAPGGPLVNLPSRMLEAADVFFREPARRMELYAGSYAQARREGLKTPAEIQERMATLLLEDTTASRQIRDAADAFAARAVFQEKTGPITAKLLALKNDPTVPLPMRAAMTFVAPFIKTPANILRQGAEFSPLGFVMNAARQDGREGSQALGRAAMGTAAAGYFAYLAATGRLTGFGPTDRGERAAFMEAGKRPNSIKVRLPRPVAAALTQKGLDMTPVVGGPNIAGGADFWINFQLFQPFSIQLAAIGNAYERFAKSDRSDKAAEESLAAALTGAAASFLDQSFLSGVNDLLDAISDPERNASRVLSTFAQGVVPASGLLRNVAQAVDPIVRQPEGIVESVKTIVPGVSKQVPPRLDRFGKPVTRPGGPIRRGFTVPDMSEELSDPVAETLDRLGVTPDLPRGAVTVRGRLAPLTRDQEFSVRQARGAERRYQLEQLINGSAFPRMSEDNQRRAVERVLGDASAAVTHRAASLLQGQRRLTLEGLVSPAARAAHLRQLSPEGRLEELNRVVGQ